MIGSKPCSSFPAVITDYFPYMIPLQNNLNIFPKQKEGKCPSD